MSGQTEPTTCRPPGWNPHDGWYMTPRRSTCWRPQHAYITAPNPSPFFPPTSTPTIKSSKKKKKLKKKMASTPPNKPHQGPIKASEPAQAKPVSTAPSNSAAAAAAAPEPEVGTFTKLLRELEGKDLNDTSQIPRGEAPPRAAEPSDYTVDEWGVRRRKRGNASSPAAEESGGEWPAEEEYELQKGTGEEVWVRHLTAPRPLKEIKRKKLER
ncbi:hypothetical protein FN846DRAFT_88830 [Sphaerosporella brunnea]|uniref:Uncharacterized protein n=1 Tax=Sphaerosporella brunnea TaxID=1250544 RepID=A0A5J5ET54_9PEZI|nr:hypothetical protein FN846DRAFT_88830 [Sphaerosporella brunnea]